MPDEPVALILIRKVFHIFPWELFYWHFIHQADSWKIGLVSKSGFLLTAGLWKTGSVSKSRFLLTADP